MHPSSTTPVNTKYSTTTPRRDVSTRDARRWTSEDDGAEVETPQRSCESVVLQKTKANDERRGAVQERRCGNRHAGELRNVEAQSLKKRWFRRKDRGSRDSRADVRGHEATAGRSVRGGAGEEIRNRGSSAEEAAPGIRRVEGCVELAR